MDDGTLKALGLFHSEVRTAASLAGVALGIVAFRNNFEDRALRDAALGSAVLVACASVFFAVAAERELAANTAGLPADQRAAVARWRAAPYLLVLALVVAGAAAGYRRAARR